VQNLIIWDAGVGMANIISLSRATTLCVAPELLSFAAPVLPEIDPDSLATATDMLASIVADVIVKGQLAKSDVSALVLSLSSATGGAMFAS
jgi:hypothetical protein